MRDSKEYKDKKALFDKMLTIYGRNAVYEALIDENVNPFRLHLSTSNANAKIMDDIKAMASIKDIEVFHHDKKELSRISKNARQDQGVALDIKMSKFLELDDFMQMHRNYRVLALDSIENPQNLGLIIRSACAGNIDVILLAKKGNAALGSLAIKASVGTLFRMPIIRVDDLDKALNTLKADDAKLYSLSLRAQKSYKEVVFDDKSVFVLGNESRGVSEKIDALCDEHIIIPLKRGVESLNVAVAASLLAFLD